MVTKELENILSNKINREGFFNNPKHYIKPAWKRIYDSRMLTTYQSLSDHIQIGIQKIYVGMRKSEYVWRVSKGIPYHMNKLVIIGEAPTKKEAIKLAMEYMKANSR